MANYLEIYKDRGKGHDNQALYVKNDDLRFRFAAKIVHDDILDVGCGFCDFSRYVTGHNYTGIDGTPWVAKYSASLCIDVMDYDTKHDWVVALGTLETCDDVKAHLEKLKSLCKQGVVFSYHTKAHEPFISYTDEIISDIMGDIELYNLSSIEKIAVWRKEESNGIS